MGTISDGGWGWPGASRRAHFFDPGEVKSLCGRWLYTGERDGADDGKFGPDDCAPCKNQLRQRREARDRREQRIKERERQSLAGTDKVRVKGT